MKKYIAPILLQVILLFFQHASTAQSDLSNPLSKFTLEADNDFWLQNEESQIINLVSYFKAATNVNEEHERYPLNISIVLDRSGSMDGDKLDRTKEAVIYLLNQLEPNDIVSVVAYASNVEVIISSQKIKDKKNLIKKIDKIESGGGTFLSGGMEKGYELIKAVRDTLQNPKYIHRVILLSDGLANEGIIDPQALTRIANKNLLENNTSTSTIGVGAGYNEELMTELAIQGTGNYYFVAKPNDISDIFAKELKGVQSLVSKNTVLKITFPENSVTLRQVHHYNYTLKGNEITFELNDVFSDNEKAFLIEFDVIKEHRGDLNFSASLTYLNALDELKPTQEELNFKVQETNSKQDIAKSYRQVGSLAQTFLLSTESFQLSTMAAEEGNFKEAESLLDNAIAAIKIYHGRFDNHPFLEDIKDNIKGYKKSLKEMQKKPKKHRNFVNRGHRQYAFRTISCPSF